MPSSPYSEASLIITFCHFVCFAFGGLLGFCCHTVCLSVCKPPEGFIHCTSCKLHNYVVTEKELRMSARSPPFSPWRCSPSGVLPSLVAPRALRLSSLQAGVAVYSSSPTTPVVSPKANFIHLFTIHYNLFFDFADATTTLDTEDGRREGCFKIF